MILADGSLPEADTAHGIGSVDRGMDGQTRRSDAPLSVEFAGCASTYSSAFARYRRA
ncbi:MAG: hypothetical protein WBV06_17670 [Acidimicrobiia bacterium]